MNYIRGLSHESYLEGCPTKFDIQRVVQHNLIFKGLSNRI